MIPKIIHYCWFGGNPKPKSVNKCIESWKKYCPDYEIIEWNENNFDVDKIPYISQALHAKKYAFASDVARLVVLYENGGLYFDTDVEMVSSFDDLLNNQAFFGFEDRKFVASGLGFGAEKNNSFIKEHLEQYINTDFDLGDGTFNMKGCPRYCTELLLEKGLVQNGQTQIVDGVTVYSSDYFNPYDVATGRINKTTNTHSIHWYDQSWNKKSQLKKKTNQLIHRMFGTDFIHKMAIKIGLR